MVYIPYNNNAWYSNDTMVDVPYAIRLMFVIP